VRIYISGGSCSGVAASAAAESQRNGPGATAPACRLRAQPYAVSHQPRSANARRAPRALAPGPAPPRTLPGANAAIAARRGERGSRAALGAVPRAAGAGARGGGGAGIGAGASAGDVLAGRGGRRGY
jgi:hypothetical protein